jgi:hypothetical protein
MDIKKEVASSDKDLVDVQETQIDELASATNEAGDEEGDSDDEKMAAPLPEVADSGELNADTIHALKNSNALVNMLRDPMLQIVLEKINGEPSPEEMIDELMDKSTLFQHFADQVLHVANQIATAPNQDNI